MRRHGGIYKEFLSKLLDHEKKDTDWLKRYQRDQLRLLITYAVEYVPYYRNIFRNKKLTIDDISSLNDLQKFPFLDKETLRANIHQFLPDSINHKRLLKIYTSGTTGKPLTVYTNPEARQKNYAFFSRFLRWAGVNEYSRKATFGGNIIVSQKQKRPPFWRYNKFQKNIIFSSYHMSEENLRYYVEALERFRPELIDSYPSSVYVLASYMKKNNIYGIKPKAVITSAETLHNEWRKVIEQVFGCKVFDQYGCTEMSVFVGQCEQGNYHINTDYGMVEILRGGKVLGPNEIGEIVATGFINPSMPLIRYRMGDVGSISDKPCSCGRPFPVLCSLEGRVDEFIITKDKRFIGRMDPILKGIFPIKVCQFVQEDIDYLNVIIEKAEGYTDSHTDSLRKEIQKRIGSDMHINIIFDTNLIKKQEKFRAVVSKVDLKLN